jgi:hypothetical protein
MNELLKNYLVDVDYPEVSGIEHLQMLKTRSELAAIAESLSTSEQQALANADRKLAMQADKFLAELNRLVDLAAERQRRQTSPDEWWWYLDILVHAPAVPIRTNELVAV